MTSKKILVYTSYDDNYSYIGDETSANKQSYAKIHNYDFLCKRTEFVRGINISWDKIFTIRELLSTCDYEYILWTDADAFIVNISTKIESLLDETALASCHLRCCINSPDDPNAKLNDGIEKILEKPVNPFLWVSADSNGPCLGSFLIKKGQKSIDFLSYLISKTQFYQDMNCWWDQRAFHYGLHKNEISSKGINICGWDVSCAKINAVVLFDFACL